MLPPSDRLKRDLYHEISRIVLIDPHSHIDPHRPTARNLDDILGYHYYTELAHSAGMDQKLLAGDLPPRERVRNLLTHLHLIDNTVQYSWFVDIVRTFLGFDGRITPADCDLLYDRAEQLMNQPEWETSVLKRTNVEMVFLTNDFDDPLRGFDARLYVPCLRTDDLVFHLGNPAVRQRLAKATGVEVGDFKGIAIAVRALFTHFVGKGAKACAISLPPDFTPDPGYRSHNLDAAFTELVQRGTEAGHQVRAQVANGVFMLLAEHCREFRLPFDLMIGVNRRVYRAGVFQGQDLFDQRTSLIQYADLFNAFPEVVFPISVLTSAQNQELVSYSWIFPNVIVNGHWWYSNIPAYITHDLKARLQAVPKIKLIGYYSDAYKLEFVLPKYNMYRRILAETLADDFVRPGLMSERQALELALLVLRGNSKRIFGV
jgi:glucuronate isomerase